MTTKLTPPKSNIPVGTVKIDGVTYDVPQHPEFVRYFFDLVRRVGGSAALTNIELETLISELQQSGVISQSDPQAQEAVRGVDELRNEFSSLRSGIDGLRTQLDDLEAQFGAVRAVADLRPRVEQLEDRLV